MKIFYMISLLSLVLLVPWNGTGSSNYTLSLILFAILWFWLLGPMHIATYRFGRGIFRKRETRDTRQARQG